MRKVGYSGKGRERKKRWSGVEWREGELNCGKKVRYSMGQGHRSTGGRGVGRMRERGEVRVLGYGREGRCGREVRRECEEGKIQC